MASLGPSIRWLSPLASLPLPSHTPPPLGSGSSGRLLSRAVAAKAETKTSTCHCHSNPTVNPPTGRGVGKLDGSSGRALNPRLPSSLSLTPIAPSPLTSHRRCPPSRRTSSSVAPSQSSLTRCPSRRRRRVAIVVVISCRAFTINIVNVVARCAVAIGVIVVSRCAVTHRRRRIPSRRCHQRRCCCPSCHRHHRQINSYLNGSAGDGQKFIQEKQ